MDLAVTHGLRREMHALLAERQTAEAEVVEQVNQLCLEFQADMVALLADWLWHYGPDTDRQDTDRKTIEAATGLSLDTWVELRRKVEAAKAEKANPSEAARTQPPSLFDALGKVAEFGLRATTAAAQATGLAGPGGPEGEMDAFLHELATKVLADLEIVRETSLGPQVQALLTELNSGIDGCWTEHREREREAVATLQAKAEALLSELESEAQRSV